VALVADVTGYVLIHLLNKDSLWGLRIPEELDLLCVLNLLPPAWSECVTSHWNQCCFKLWAQGLV